MPHVFLLITTVHNFGGSACPKRRACCNPIASVKLTVTYRICYLQDIKIVVYRTYPQDIKNYILWVYPVD